MINFDLVVGFQWDMGNLRKSELKHSVSQLEAEEIFFNEPLLINLDEKHSKTEQRFLALGVSNAGRLLTSIFTLRENQTLIRVISIRDQHKKERLVYAKAN